MKSKHSNKKFKILVLILINLTILVIPECFLRVTGFAKQEERPDPFFGFFGSYRAYGPETLGSFGTVLGTNPNKLSTLQLEYFTSNKKPGAIRIFCLGGSTVHGSYYRETYVRVLKLLTAQQMGDGRLEIINCGGAGYSIQQILKLARELVHYEPDIFIIITGHNEFSSIRYHRDLLNQGPFVRFMRVFLDNFRLVHLLKHFLGVIKPAKIHYEHTPPHGPITAEERAYILSQMRTNLTETAGIITQANAKLILGPAAMNLKHPPSGLRNKASLYYLEAEILLSERRYEEAYQAYWKALEHDISPVRMFPAQIDVIQEIAGKVGATYINMQTLFNQQAPEGIPGNTLFNDSVHPNCEGNIIIARMVFQALKKIIRPGEQSGGDIDRRLVLPELKPEELIRMLKNKDPLTALAAAVKLSKQKDANYINEIRTYFAGTKSLVIKKMFLENMGTAESFVIPFLIELITTNPFIFDARQALLSITGQFFGLRSYFVEQVAGMWKKWWKKNASSLNRRQLLGRQIGAVISRLRSDDLNVRLASISILKELTGTTLEYNALDLIQERESAVCSWEEYQDHAIDD